MLIELVRGVPEYGWTVIPANPRDQDPKGSALASELERSGYRAAPFSRWSFLRSRRWILEQVAQTEPALIHAQNAEAILLLATLRKWLNVPLIASHQHGDYFTRNGKAMKGRLDRWATQRFDVIVAVSKQVQRFLIESYGVNRKNLCVIPNGWGGMPLPPSPPAQPTVVTVGNFRPEKGHGVLLFAMAQVANKIPEARLVLLGDGPLRPILEAQADRLGLATNVKFLGRKQDVWPHLSGSHLFCLPSFSETAGIAAMEAMAAALPVVASEVGGLPELIGKDAGLLVPPGDIDALADALIFLLDHPHDAVLMGQAGKRRAADYSARAMVERYCTLFERLG